MSFELYSEGGYNIDLNNPMTRGEKESGPEKWLIEGKIAKNRKQADFMLAAVGSIFIIVAVLILIFGSNSNEKTYLEDIPENIKNTLPEEIMNKFPSQNE